MRNRTIVLPIFVAILAAFGFWYFLEVGPWLGLPLLDARPGFKLNASGRNSRPSNYHELFYTQIAGYFGDPKICAKIGPTALDEEWGLSSKWRVNFQRSECYFYAAQKTKDETLCKYVRKVITIPLNASDVSDSECKSLLKTSGNTTFNPALFFDPSADLMRELGYRDEDYYELVSERKISAEPNGGVDWGAFYSYLMFFAPPERRVDFLQRADALPSFN